ncbi:MAG: electron transfer flavoprotein subunit beta/FixA family protein [Chlorobiaceae bacterium]
MHIAVCLCQVPDTASVIGFAEGAIDLSRVNEVLNPFDEYALEEAVRLKERFEGSVVTLFSVSSSSAKEMLRKALAMGGDRAVLVSAPEPLDPSQTATLLSRAIAAFYAGALPDLVFCGKHSTDFQSAQVPLMLAELLGMASVSAIVKLHATAEGLQVEREIEGGIEYYDVHYPALFSVEKGLNVPRKTTIKAVMEARKKPVDLLPLDTGESPFVAITGMEPLVIKKTCRFVTEPEELVRLLRHDRALF